MRGRSKRAQRFAERSEPAQAREELERRWAGRIAEEPRLATLVTAGAASREPIHRWLPYRQGFSPGLVRLFLKENPPPGRSDPGGRVMDPFSGAGTCVVECARQGVRAVGVEALTSLVFVTEAKLARWWPPLPELPNAERWEEFAERLEEPIHRAALMIAEARRHTAEGRINRGARPISEVFREVARMMRDDLCHPAALANEATAGDARRLEQIEDGTIEAILTSPPYLTRYDYRRTNDPLEKVFSFWHPPPRPTTIADPFAMQTARGEQLRARVKRAEEAPAKHRRRRLGGMGQRDAIRGISAGDLAFEPSDRDLSDAAVAEAAQMLGSIGQPAAADSVFDYFEDLSEVFAAARRVLRPGAPAWFVIGGARIKDVYVPADLIAARQAEAAGFAVSAVRAARDLTPSRRKFGRIGHVAPRESVLVMTRT